MKTNMGLADRGIRSIIAIVLIALYYTGTITGAWAITSILLAVVFLLTSMMSFCPLYLPFGLSTVRKKMVRK